jgi:hypothetical protein
MIFTNDFYDYPSVSVHFGRIKYSAVSPQFTGFEKFYYQGTKNLIVIKLFVKSSFAFGKPSTVFIPSEIRCPIKKFNQILVHFNLRNDVRHDGNFLCLFA